MIRTQNSRKEFSPEMWLVLAGAMNDRFKIEHVLKYPVKWEQVLRLVMRHEVYPQVYKTFLQIGSPAIPKKVLDVLRTTCRDNTMHALNMAGETTRVVRILEKRGISLIVLKGAPLAHYLYGDVTNRPSNDIDILVTPNQMEISSRILEAHGYSKVQAHPEEVDLTPEQLNIYSKLWPDPDHFIYWNQDKGVVLELQCNLGHCGQVPLSLSQTDCSNRINIAGTSVPILAYEDWLLYIISHGGRHAWSRLRWLVDVGWFMRRDIDWEKLDSLAMTLGVRHILYHVVELAESLLGVVVPDKYQPFILKDRKTQRLIFMARQICISHDSDVIPRPSISYDDFIRYMYEFEVSVGWRSKVSYAMKLFRPTGRDIKFIDLPVELCGLYYVIRPVALLHRVLFER